MRKLAIGILGLILLSMFAIPQFTAAPGGIGNIGDNGCSCHGSPSADTTVTVTGLPEQFNASETYPFTVTVTNDAMTLWADGIEEDGWNTRAGGFRILASKGTVTSVDPTLSQEKEGGLTHTDEGNKFRTWDFEWVAPADDTVFTEFTINANAVNGGSVNTVSSAGATHSKSHVRNLLPSSV